MRVKMLVAKGSRKTGEILNRLLAFKHGVQFVGDNPDAILCYGVGYPGELPAINKECGRYDKASELVVLYQNLYGKAPECCIPNSGEEVEPEEMLGYYGTILGRKFKHSQGLDIEVIDNSRKLARSKADFYTNFVPSETEFRTWVFRNHHLGTYEKIKTREPAKKYRHKFGRSYRLGYAFKLVKKEFLKPEAVEIGKQAVRALGLDFGAVDILWHPEQYPVVLEVNSAPGVEGDGRQAICKLAENISRRLRKLCPE